MNQFSIPIFRKASQLLSKNGMLTVLFLGSLFISSWLTHSLSPASRESGQVVSLSTPDAFMTDAHYTEFDPSGNWKSSFDTPHLTHYQEQDTAVLQKPLLITKDDQQLTWVIKAQHAVSQNHGTILKLQDQVHVQRFDSEKKNLELTTTQLTSYPKQRYLETHEPVTIIQPGSIMNSIGLAADMNNGNITLLSQAHGSYQPADHQDTKTP